MWTEAGTCSKDRLSPYIYIQLESGSVKNRSNWAMENYVADCQTTCLPTYLSPREGILIAILCSSQRAPKTFTISFAWSSTTFYFWTLCTLYTAVLLRVFFLFPLQEPTPLRATVPMPTAMSSRAKCFQLSGGCAPSATSPGKLGSVHLCFVVRGTRLWEFKQDRPSVQSGSKDKIVTNTELQCAFNMFNYDCLSAFLGPQGL